MKKQPELIVMLTYNDCTVENAMELFESAVSSKANYWGIKEEGLGTEKMKALFDLIRKNGKKPVLEVVAYDEVSCVKGALTAVECGADIMMGTLFYDSVNEICKKHSIKYMPFVGDIADRPSVLKGSIDDMIKEANECINKGADGVDLLCYRYAGDALELLNKFIEGVNAPVCIAGSIDSYKKVDQVKNSRAWAFTIGSAFFDKNFGDGLKNQINAVCDYLVD